MIQLKLFNHNLIVVDSIIVYIKNCKKKIIKYFYMQIRHCLIKYRPIYIHFQNLNIGWDQFQNVKFIFVFDYELIYLISILQSNVFIKIIFDFFFLPHNHKF